MKLIIDISDNIYDHIKGYCKIFDSEYAYTVNAIANGTPIEAQPTGKWIEYEVDVAPHPLHCSICGFSNHHISNRYMREFRRCPNCGAEISGGGENEVSD